MDEEPTLRGTLRTVVAVAREQRVSLVAASLAYYSFNSLVPFVLLLFVAFSVFGRFELLASTAGLLLGSAPAEIEPLIRGIAESGDPGRLVGIAAVVFLWSTLRMFRAVDGAFEEVYQTAGRETLVSEFFEAAVVFLTVAVALASMGVLAVTLDVLVRGWIWRLVGPLVLVLALAVVFFPMYYLFPETDVSIRETVPGAVLAAGAWTVASIGFRVYAATTASVELYGVAGAVLLVLTWLYVGALVLLLGAVLNAVIGGHVSFTGP